MPTDADGLTYWELTYPTTTLDERLVMREELQLLRADPNVRLTDGGLVSDLRVARGLGTGFLTVTIRFIPGADGPAQRDLRRILGSRETTPEWVVPPGPQRGGFRGVIDALLNRDPPPLDPNSPEYRDSLITRALRDPEGRSRLANAMINPIRTRIDYQSVGRRMFLVEQLPEGALPIYDRDPEVAAVLTRGAWERTRRELETHRIQPTTMMLSQGDLDDLVKWQDEATNLPPLPEWCVVGAFVMKNHSSLIGVISEVTKRSVLINAWSAGAWEREIFFLDETAIPWSLCEKPKLFVKVQHLSTRYDRVDQSSSSSSDFAGS